MSRKISKGTCEGRLTTVRGCLDLSTAHVKALGTLKKERKKKKAKLIKPDFHRFQVRHFSNNFEQSHCYCKDGATPE